GYAFWFWMPTMLQRLTGWTDVQRIGWIGAIPFVAGLIGMLLLGWNSDRTRERRWHFAVPQLTAALALGAWFLAPHSIALLIVVFTLDRKSTRLNSSHQIISYAVFCSKNK